MEPSQSAISQLLEYFLADPLRGTAALAAMIALASTPIAFALLGRREYLNTRRGRTYRRPEWWSVVCSMLLVMTIPSILLALLVKSQYFDENRYEFDPNKTWTVIDQGRQYRTLDEMNEAIRQEMERLAQERQDLVNGVMKLDQSMLELRAVIDQAPQVAQTLPEILNNLADIRQAVGVDAPQQLEDYTAPPVELARLPRPMMAPYGYAPMPPGADLGAAPPAAAEPAGPGLTPSQLEIEMASVPEAQRKIAAMLPLTNLPEGWEIGQSGNRHLETFSADDLYEKIDGRAESFVQYDVVGMAYTYYNPEGDPSAEVQVYIFEMGSPLKALGKYGSERPDEAEPIDLGSSGYTSGASVFFHAGPYYTQVVPTSDSPEFREFARAIAERIVDEQTPGKSSSATQVAAVSSAAEDQETAVQMPTQAEPMAEAGATEEVSPEAIFALLPDEPGRGGDKYVAQDVFGYAFLSDVFMADYDDDATTWQAFVRPYPDADSAKEVFDQYRGEAEAFDAKINEVETESADALFISENFGLIDVIFLKGNAVGGVNGASDVDSARAFAESFAESMPVTSPFME